MNFKRIIAIFAVAAMMLAVLCGCGSGDQNNDTVNTSEPIETTTAPIVTTTAPTEDNSKVDYTVTVVDEEGNPISGVTLQFCDAENCKMPVATDDNGMVTASYAPSEYHVTVTLPEGYTSEVTEFYFEGETELTIVLTAEAGE